MNLYRVSLPSMMCLKHFSLPEQRSQARLFDENRRYDEAECVRMFMKYYGRQVKVTRGRKEAKGTEGECVWMGYTSYTRWPSMEQVRKSIRICIKDAEGTLHWTYLPNVELLPQPGVITRTDIPEHFFQNEERVNPWLYELSEVDDARPALERLEFLVAEYNGKREAEGVLHYKWRKAQDRLGDGHPEEEAAFDTYYDVSAKMHELKEAISRQISVCNKLYRKKQEEVK